MLEFKVVNYAKEKPKSKKLWRTRSVRHSFLGFTMPIYVSGSAFMNWYNLQQIENKPTTKFFVKAPLCGAFTKNLGLVCSQSAIFL